MVDDDPNLYIDQIKHKTGISFEEDRKREEILA